MMSNRVKEVSNQNGKKYLIELDSNLGKGQFGIVKRCYSSDNPHHSMACKIILRN